MDNTQYVVQADAALVEMINSDGPNIKALAFATIRQQIQGIHDTGSSSSTAGGSSSMAGGSSSMAGGSSSMAGGSSSTADGSSSNDIKVWTEKESKALFHLRSEREQDFLSHKVHKMLWDKIAANLRTQNINVTPMQCSNKWKSLKREYKKTVDSNSQTGEEKKTCPFYTEFNNLYGHKSGTKPQYEMGSLNSFEKNIEPENTLSDSDNEKEDNSNDHDDKEQSSSRPKKAKRSKKQRKKEDETIALFKEYKESQEEYRKELAKYRQDRSDCSQMTWKKTCASWEYYGLNLKTYDYEKPSLDYDKDLHYFLNYSDEIHFDTDSDESTKTFSCCDLKELEENFDPDLVRVSNTSVITLQEFHSIILTRLESYVVVKKKKKKQKKKKKKNLSDI